MALTVIFHSNYGVDETESVTTTSTGWSGDYEVWVENSPSYYGWSKPKCGFQYWSTESDGSGSKYYCDDEHGIGVVRGPVGEDTVVDLYAFWWPLFITITYHSNISGNDTVYKKVFEVDAGDTVPIDLYPSDIGWSYENYGFLYWSKKPYPTEPIIDPSVFTRYVDIDYDVYAIWRPTSSGSLPITLTYHSNIPGYNETYSVTDNEYGLIRTTMVPDDQEWFYDNVHEFHYWCTSPDGRGDIYYSDDEHITGWVYDTTDLYAIWGHTKEHIKQIEIFNSLSRIVVKEKLNNGVTYSISLSRRHVR